MASFSEQLQIFADQFEIKASDMVRKVTLDAFTFIIMASPVAEGTFRANWRVGVTQIDTSITAAPDSAKFQDPPSSAQMSYAMNEALAANVGDEVFITNNLIYAVPLENGHSRRQAPNGVLYPVVTRIIDQFNNETGGGA